MSKLLALFDLFRKGSVVADPALWKRRQIAASVLLPVFGSALAVARVFGCEIPVSDEQVAQVVGGLVVVINVVLTFTTSDKVGLLAERAPVDPG